MNRVAFLHGKIPQLQRRLSYLERGNGSKWEIEHVRSALDDLTAELATLEGESPKSGRQTRQAGGDSPTWAPAPGQDQAPIPPSSAGDEPPKIPKRQRGPRIRAPRFRFRGRRWFRWRFVYLLLFLIIFAWYIRGDVTGTPSSQDYKLWGYTLALWNLSIPIPLLLYSLVSAFMLFIPIRVLGWGARQITRHRVGKGAFAIVLVFLVVGFAVSNSPLQSAVIPSPNQFYSSLSDMGSYATELNNQVNSATTQTVVVSQTPTTTSQSIGFTTSNPQFEDGKANITYPSDYDELARFALGLINTDRTQNGLQNVTLSTVPSGQQHADSMLYFGYFSHWDTQGYKPYMRYTMLGGSSAVSENGGLDYCTDSPPSAISVYQTSCDLQTVENGLANSEWSMMNNDQQCCNNGHRDNILNPLHNRVSLGIAYDSTSETIYFVEDFEDAYTTFSLPLYSSGLVTLRGTTSTSIDVNEIGVFYDPTPSSLTTAQLDASPYNDGYDAGTSLGAVFAPCPQGYTCSPNTTDGGIAVYASVWSLTASSFEIQFDPSRFFAQGSGVYSLYMFDTNNEIYTTLSVFIA
jgi:uncharacterized protein YkwD